MKGRRAALTHLLLGLRTDLIAARSQLDSNELRGITGQLDRGGIVHEIIRALHRVASANDGIALGGIACFGIGGILGDCSRTERETVRSLIGKVRSLRIANYKQIHDSNSRRLHGDGLIGHRIFLVHGILADTRLETILSAIILVDCDAPAGDCSYRSGHDEFLHIRFLLDCSLC